jgi:ElaB/YqjD/DUF883 family membrane-anchored ribosome-binding protein
MTKDACSDEATSMGARVTKVGEAIGERVKTVTAATAAAAGRAQNVLDDAAETAQQAWSQAGEVAEGAVDAARRATRSVSRQIGENPVISVLVGCALGYIAGWWIHGRTAGKEEPQTVRPAPKHPRPENKG